MENVRRDRRVLQLYLPSLAIRWARRETLRLALFLCTTPRCAARMMVGSASLNAANAAVRSPLAIASSILRTELRSSERRDLLTSVLRAILRVALRAELVLAMSLSLTTGISRRKDRPSDRSLQESVAARYPAATGEAYSKAPLRRQRPQYCVSGHPFGPNGVVTGDDGGTIGCR